MSEWDTDDDMSLDLKVRHNDLVSMQLGSEVAEVVEGIDWSANKTVQQWSKMLKFFNMKLAECGRLESQWSVFFNKAGYPVNLTGMLDAWEDFADQTKQWHEIEGPEELGALVVLLEGTRNTPQDKCAAVASGKDDSDQEVESDEE